MPESPPRPAVLRAVGYVRVGFGLVVLAVIGYAYLLSIAAGRANPIDYFGYFTNLTSLLTSVVLVVTGARNLRGIASPTWLVSFRAVATVCMLVVGVIYNVLVPGTGTAPLWVSVILHLVFPLYTLLDWALVGDRTAIPWRRLWIVLPYPLLWLAVVLMRGATDGWVPYGFLLPSQGLMSLAMHCGGLLVALLAAGALTWGCGRLPGVGPFTRDAIAPSTELSLASRSGSTA